MKKGFNLLELIIAMVIIAILAVISFPKIRTMREDSIDQEVIANLKLIQAAEKIYKMEAGYYIETNNIVETNSQLKLSIPASGGNWYYKVEDVTSSGFTGKAQRTADSSKVRCIQEEEDPYNCDGSW